MLITEELTIRMEPGRKKRLVSYGFEYKRGRFVTQKIEDLRHDDNVLVEMVCDTCGVYFWQPYNKYKSNQSEDYCGKCSRKRLLGYNIFPPELLSYCRGSIGSWVKDSLKHHKNKCIITGEESNIIHHTRAFTTILMEAIKINNLDLVNYEEWRTSTDFKVIGNKCKELHYYYGYGACLSKEMHKLFHSKYGIYNNTEEQFSEFYAEVKIKINKEEKKNGNEKFIQHKGRS